MSTTTIRLPVELKSRIDKLASAAGKSSHAFMIDALAQAAESNEREREFDAEVNRRWAKFQRTGEYISLEDMRDYALARAAGKNPPRPKLRIMEDAPRAPKTAKATKTAKSA
jgi:predicted transcriptional regulator